MKHWNGEPLSIVTQGVSWDIHRRPHLTFDLFSTLLFLLFMSPASMIWELQLFHPQWNWTNNNSFTLLAYFLLFFNFKKKFIFLFSDSLISVLISISVTVPQVISCFYLFFFFFWLHHSECGILVPRLGMEPEPLQWKQGPNHRNSREVPGWWYFWYAEARQ